MLNSRRGLLLALVVVAALAFVFSLRANTNGPAQVNEVPRTLSGQGVEISNRVLLTPLEVVPAKALTAAAAIRAARAYAGKLKHAPAAALEASASFRGRPITNVPCWVVTFTSSKPFRVRSNAGVSAVRHFSVVLGATTGKLVFGFFTP